jgi:glutamyl-tRNA reductase
VEDIIHVELKKSSSALGELTSSQNKAIRSLTRSIAEKVINDPIIYLKRKADRPSLNMYLDVTRRLFKLDEGNGDDNK